MTLLDSGNSPRGRWDVLAMNPLAELVLEARASAAETERFIDALLRTEARLPNAVSAEEQALPFCGGLIGFFSYELGRRLQGLAASSNGEQPLAVVRHYRGAIVQDHALKRSCYAGYSSSDGDTPSSAEESGGRDIARRIRAASVPGGDGITLRSPFKAPWDYEAYRERFDRVLEYIAAGDCYQMNLGQPYSARYSGSLLQAYDRLRPVARAPYSAFFPLSDKRALLSMSPERFLTVQGRQVESSPIKGTRPRHGDEDRDRALANELSTSVKERAENLMIVDLLRNDIGRFCVPGSVHADRLFELHSYATVHHLVSRVRGRLRDDVKPLQLLLGCLPGGSITGAPKYRAMQLIDELEPAPRESWTGTLFCRSAGGRLDSNILIRTLYGDGEKLTCWAGGGLVADSRPEQEYRELEHKVGALLRSLEAD